MYIAYVIPLCVIRLVVKLLIAVHPNILFEDMSRSLLNSYIESLFKRVLQIKVPPTCIIGEWKVAVKTVSKVTDKDGKEKETSFVFRKNKPSYVITILFNPWCKGNGSFVGRATGERRATMTAYRR